MATYTNSTNDELPQGIYADGDTLTTRSGDRWWWVAGGWKPQMYTAPDTIIRPEWFPGNAVQRITAAITSAISSRGCVVLRDMFEITGQGPIYIPAKSRRLLKIYGDGGGIIKRDGGYVFTSLVADRGDIHTEGMRYEGTPGAGGVVWDCNKLIRIYSFQNEYKNWDTVFEADFRYTQQCEFVREHVVGGRGWAVSFAESWATKIHNWVIEDRNLNGAIYFQIPTGTARIVGISLKNGDPIHLKTTGLLPSGVSADTDYYIVELAGEYFKLSETPNGTPIVLSGTQLGIHTFYFSDGHGIRNSAEAPNNLTNRSLSIVGNVIENNKGHGIRLANTAASVIADNYFEKLRGIPIDMQTFQAVPHMGLVVRGNLFGSMDTPGAAIKWGTVAGSLASGHGGCTSEGNYSQGDLHDIGLQCLGYISGNGDVSGGKFIAGKSAMYRQVAQAKTISNGDGSVKTLAGPVTKLKNTISVVVPAKSSLQIKIPFFDVLLSDDSVSVIVSDTTGVQVLSTSIDTSIGSYGVVAVISNTGDAAITRSITAIVNRLG